jgi:hypothetical protein
MDDAFKSYFPMGDCDGKTYSMWTIPHNPYSQKPEWPTIGKLTSAKGVTVNARLRPGQLEYSPKPAGKGYYIRAGGPDGFPVKNQKGKPVIIEEDTIELLKAHARTVQWACEHYAENNHNLFPKTIDESVKCYFPFGDRSFGKKQGSKLINPFTGKGEWPVAGSIVNVAQARAMRPGPLSKGLVEYSCIPGRRNYAIRLGDRTGMAISGISGKGSTYVIARDGDGSGHEKQF